MKSSIGGIHPHLQIVTSYCIIKEIVKGNDNKSEPAYQFSSMKDKIEKIR